MSESADPVINDLNRPFWDGADNGELVLPHCVASGRAFWPPAPISPYRGGREVEWRLAAMQGTVMASVIYRRPFQKAFAALIPYGIAMVALDCGPRLQVHIEAPDAPDAPKAGIRVQLGFKVLLQDGKPLLIATKLEE